MSSKGDELLEKLRHEWNHNSLCPCGSICIHSQPFINVKKLRKWMYHDEQGTKPNIRILHDELIPDPPVWYPSKRVIKGLVECVSVLSLLHEQSQAKLLPFFVDAGITDNKLSQTKCDYDELRSILNDNRIPNICQIINHFEKNRWRFCPVEISSWTDSIQRLDPKLRLPYILIENVGEGGQAPVFQVAVVADLISDSIKRYLKQPFPVGDTECYALAIKAFSQDQSKVFESEEKTLRSLFDKAGVIRFFGGYEHKHEHAGLHPTYFILMECGVFNLRNFLIDCNMIVSKEDVIVAWQKVCAIAHAIRDVHSFKFDEREIHGWHGDIKPANIVCVDYEWKLVDFGFSKLRPTRADESKLAQIDIGPSSYGAPELAHVPGGKSPLVSQTIDIWSFGCVLSEVATWISTGPAGVRRFDVIRYEAHRGRQVNSHAFHDGEKVIDEVRSWHKKLREDIRNWDKISKKILELVDQRMLVVKEHRIGCRDLVTELNLIMKEATANLSQEELSNLENIRRKFPSVDSVYTREAISAPSSSVHHKAVPFISSEHPKSLASSPEVSKHAATQTLSTEQNVLSSDISIDREIRNSVHQLSRSNESERPITTSNSSDSQSVVAKISSSRRKKRTSYQEDIQNLFKHIKDLKNNDEVLISLVNHQPEAVNEADDDGRSLLMLAARNGRMNFFLTYLSEILTLEHTDIGGQTIIHHVIAGTYCYNKGEEVAMKDFQSLFDQLEARLSTQKIEALLNCKDKHNTTALNLCAMWGMTGHANELIRRGATEVSDGKKFGKSLKLAVGKNHETTVRSLLKDHGAEFEWNDLKTLNLTKAIRKSLSDKNPRPRSGVFEFLK